MISFLSSHELLLGLLKTNIELMESCNRDSERIITTNDYIHQYKNVNINIAVQTEHGLFVPVIRDAGKKGLSKIGEEIKQLAAKAKKNSLNPDDYEGGTLTISNLGGPFGDEQFCAIVSPPQDGTVAVGTAEKRVVRGAGPDQFTIAYFMPVLIFKVRVVPGDGSDQFTIASFMPVLIFKAITIFGNHKF